MKSQEGNGTLTHKPFGLWMGYWGQGDKVLMEGGYDRRSESAERVHEGCMRTACRARFSNLGIKSHVLRNFLIKQMKLEKTHSLESNFSET